MDRSRKEPPAPEAPGEADDPLAAHLDRAWDLLERGELAAARTAIDAALAEEPDSPEGITALGAWAAASGEPDDALGHFERAMALAPDYIDPFLQAAELLLYPLGEAEEAIELCDAALEIAEEEQEYLDALLLKAEAQLELGEEDEARTTLGELPPTALPDAQLELRAGRLLLDVGELLGCERHLRAALERSPELTDAVHGLALLAEARGDRAEMIRLFQEVREADLAEPPPQWGLTAERFDEVAHEALAALPEPLRRRLGNVPILVSDYPSAALCQDGTDPRSLGLFAGVPFPEQATMGASPHLEAVMLFSRNIERACRSASEVEDETHKTLIHETAHFFGLSEEELEGLGLA